MLTRLPSLTHSVLFVLQEVVRGHEMDEPSVVLFTSLYMYIFVESLVMLSFMLIGLYRNMTPRVLIIMKIHFFYEMLR